jgi:hypothetical protein
MTKTEEKILKLEGEIEQNSDNDEPSFSLIIKRYKIFTISLVALGLIAAVIGVFKMYNPCCGFQWNEYGDFVGGTVGSLWALAGIVLIYIAFLGQKQQIALQQIELKYSRIEILYSRLELEKQRGEIKNQNFTLYKQSSENSFKNYIELLSKIKNNLDQFYVLSNSPYPNNLNYLGFSGFLILDSIKTSHCESREGGNKWVQIFKGQERLFESTLMIRYTEIQESHKRLLNSILIVAEHIRDVVIKEGFKAESEKLKSFYIRVLKQNLSYVDLVLIVVFSAEGFIRETEYSRLVEINLFSELQPLMFPSDKQRGFFLEKMTNRV